MKQNYLIDIAKLRLCVGFLGEKHANSWWGSSFFSSSSKVFLSPIFGKTSFLAQYYGVKEAAMAVHDKHIGTGKEVFHLFRLPEMIEIELHKVICDADFENHAMGIIANNENAKQFLNTDTKSNISSSVGPIRVGSTENIEKDETWNIVARHYLNALQEGKQVFPYFSERYE